MPEQTAEATEALASLAAALGLEASPDEIARSLPVVSRALTHMLGSAPLVELGETEPAFGLRYDVGDRRSGDED